MLKNRIKEIRKSQNISQEKLAELVNASQSHLNLLENGKRQLTLVWLERISKALNVSPSQLISDDINKKSSSINKLLLTKIIEEVDKFIISRGISITSEKKAKAIIIIYDHASENQQIVDQTSINHETSIILAAFDEK